MSKLTTELATELGQTARFVLKRIQRINVERVTRHGRIHLKRGQKWLRRRRTPQPSTGKVPVFIAGSNKSGTQMVCRALGNSSHGWDYPESDFSIAFDSYQLRSDWLIRWLIASAPAPIVSFGSILDSQFIDALLSRFDGARALWVYRGYQDAANSSVRHWGSHHKEMARWVARGELDKLGARGKRVSDETVQLFADLFREELSDEDCSCLYWYMRNRVYFDLNLDANPRVLIVQYEDAVQNQEKAFRRIFAFLGFPYHPEVSKDVFATSVGRDPWPEIDPRIQQACDALQQQLDRQYAATGGNPAVN